MIRGNGKNYTVLYFNGKRYVKAYYGNRLIMQTPDTNTYLLAARGVRLLAKEHTALLATLAPGLRTTEKEYDLNGPFCLKIYFRWPFDVKSIFALGNSLRLKTIPEGLLLQVGETAPWLVPAGSLRNGENVIEIARNSRYQWYTGLFVNHKFYNVRLQEGGYPVASDYFVDKNCVKLAAFAKNDTLSAESQWPALTIVKADNLIPTDITRNNLYGFEMFDTHRESDPIRSFNPQIDTNYPRWQASAIGAACTLKLPENKDGRVLQYTVGQWYDNTYSSRKCIKWRLEGSFDGQNFSLIHEVLNNPWPNDTKGLELTFKPKDPNNYRWLRFTMLDNPGHGSYISIGQIRFLTPAANGAQDFIFEK